MGLSDQGCKVKRQYFKGEVIFAATCTYPELLCDPDPGEMGKECLVCERSKK